MQIIEFRDCIFILVRLSRVRPFAKPEFARTCLSRYLLLLKMKYRWVLELRMSNVISSQSAAVLYVFEVNGFQ